MNQSLFTNDSELVTDGEVKLNKFVTKLSWVCMSRKVNGNVAKSMIMACRWDVKMKIY